MKTLIFFIALCLIGFNNPKAQEFKGRSQPASINISNQVSPPQLALVQGSVKFKDENSNNCIDANEQCALEFVVQNNGLGEAIGLEAVITALEAAPGLIFENSYPISTIAVGKSQAIRLPFKTDMNTADGAAQIQIKINEPNGFGMAAFSIKITSRKFAAPMVVINNYSITNAADNDMQQVLFTQTFYLNIQLYNQGDGPANNVELSMQLPADVNNINFKNTWSFNPLEPGAYHKIKIPLAISENFKGKTLNIPFTITEKYKRFAQNKTISIAIADKIPDTVPSPIPNPGPPPALASDVDINIPNTASIDENTLVFIIANEDYKKLPKVPFAINDARSFYNYCTLTLGIPKDHIMFLKNVTATEIKNEIEKVFAELIATYKGKCKVLFYYAGHGSPGMNNKASIIPFDGYANSPNDYVKLDDIYAALTKYPSLGVTAFVDACFTGQNRDNKPLDENRSNPVMPDVEEELHFNKLVVFSATDYKQPAYAYNRQQHGTFTYFLLKKIKETKGDVSYAELHDYLETNVKRTVLIEKKQNQTPTLFCEPQMKNKLKDIKLK